MNPISETPALKRLLTNLRERHEWEAANPELAAAWEEALVEDHALMLARERENTLRHARERANNALKQLDVADDAIAALRSPSDTDAMKAAKQFLLCDKVFLLLLGEVGTGKTVAAAHVLQEAITARYAQNRPSGYEARVSDAALFVRASTFARMSSYANDDRQWFDRLCAAEALALDDLGTESANPHSAALIDELLDRRFAKKLKTVITGNMDTKSLAERVGARAADRIGQYALVCVSKGASLRTGKRYGQLKAVKS